jgi:hypothetical protein
MSSGGDLLSLGRCYRVTLQIARVLALINQALQRACLRSGIVDGPGIKTAYGDAHVLALVDALENVRRPPSRRDAQAESWRHGVPQERLFLFGRALEPVDPASRECHLRHIAPSCLISAVM